MSAHLYVPHMSKDTWSPEDVKSPETGIRVWGGCELPNMDAEN